MTRILISALLAATAIPAAAQDGSGVERERTKATAHEFFTKVVERTKAPIKVDGKVGTDVEFARDQLRPFNFPPGQLLSMKVGANDCLTEVKAVYLAHGTGGVPPSNPNVGVFFKESGVQFVIGKGTITWADVLSVTRTGETVFIKSPYDYRFIFPSEELAQRFGQAMEFLRTQCNTNQDDDLAF